MKYKVAEDSRPQLTLLVIATVISIALWLVVISSIRFNFSLLLFTKEATF
jgi:hypothetical protein